MKKLCHFEKKTCKFFEKFIFFVLGKKIWKNCEKRLWQGRKRQKIFSQIERGRDQKWSIWHGMPHIYKYSYKFLQTLEKQSIPDLLLNIFFFSLNIFLSLLKIFISLIWGGVFRCLYLGIQYTYILINHLSWDRNVWI